jgi:hypothetical protein
MCWNPDKCCSILSFFLLFAHFHSTSRFPMFAGGVGVRASMTSASLGGKLSGSAPQATPAGTGLVVFKLRGRLRDGEMQRSESGANQGG